MSGNGNDKRTDAFDVGAFDERMIIASGEDAGGISWIDGRKLPIEGRPFDDVDEWYDRLPSGVPESVNEGVRNMKHYTAGMQFRFATDSPKLSFEWIPLYPGLAMDHMPASGVSGIDVYRFDGGTGRWRYVKTGRIDKPERGFLELGWTPGAACLVHLPLYNGLASFRLGLVPGSAVRPLGPRRSGIDKPVVFYGTSITHGGCASRPGMAFVNIVGRDLDVPVVNLGFSGSGVMEFAMSDYLARIDASCYVLDCLWNMGISTSGMQRGRNVDENYEPFLRNLRAKRPGVPIVMAGQCDVYGNGPGEKDRYVEDLYGRLVAEGWTDLLYLPKEGMFPDDGEGTVDGCHPNDYGMVALSRAYGRAVASALGLPRSGAPAALL